MTISEKNITQRFTKSNVVMAKRGDDRILTFAETEEDWGDNGSQGKTLSVPLGD